MHSRETTAKGTDPALLVVTGSGLRCVVSDDKSVSQWYGVNIEQLTPTDRTMAPKFYHGDVPSDQIQWRFGPSGPLVNNRNSEGDCVCTRRKLTLWPESEEVLMPGAETKPKKTSSGTWTFKLLRTETFM